MPYQGLMATAMVGFLPANGRQMETPQKHLYNLCRHRRMHQIHPRCTSEVDGLFPNRRITEERVSLPPVIIFDTNRCSTILTEILQSSDLEQGGWLNLFSLR